MAHRIIRHLRANVVAYLALGIALGGGGGYAVAATSRSKTITVCAQRKTGLLYLHQRGRCQRGQTKVSWNQQGVPGPQGAAGPAGASAVSVWAEVSDSGAVVSGNGLSVEHVSGGTYRVTVSSPGCAAGFNAPTVTVSDSNPPAGDPAGAFPVAWIEGGGTQQAFTVVTGVVTSGTFTATDHTFDIQDACS